MGNNCSHVIYYCIIRLTALFNDLYHRSMDPKQKNLSPELKAIYDRVMNTKITTRPQEAAPAIPGEQTQEPAQEQPASPPQPTVNTPLLRTEVIETPPSPPQQPTAEPVAMQAAPAMPQEASPQPAKSSVDLSPIEPESAPPSSQGFLSSLPPRPLNSLSQEPFVFTAGKTDQPKNDKNEATAQPAEKTPSAGGKISSKIIIGLLVVFLGVYSLFWAKMFGLF